ncbi:DUF874 family protein, partial [Helicobacter pylori]
FNSAIGVATITTMLMNVCFADDQSKKEVAETQKEAENARDRANKSGIELGQEQQKTSNIETNNQIKVEQEKQKTEQEKQKTEQEKQKTEQEKQKTEQEKQKTEQEKQKTSNIETNNQIKVEQEKQKTNNTQKDLVNKAEQNCQENHSQFFIKKLGIKGGIAIEIEAECKTPKPAKTNQTPIQPKHLPNS